MNAISKGQVNHGAAEIYDEFFVPALFAEWSPRLVNTARLAPGQRVLDVACGTGVFARTTLPQGLPGGAVTGVDRRTPLTCLDSFPHLFQLRRHLSSGKILPGAS